MAQDLIQMPLPGGAPYTGNQRWWHDRNLYNAVVPPFLLQLAEQMADHMENYATVSTISCYILVCDDHPLPATYRFQPLRKRRRASEEPVRSLRETRYLYGRAYKKKWMQVITASAVWQLGL